MPNVYVLTDENGNEIGRREYDAFGNVLSETGDWSQSKSGFSPNWMELKDSSGRFVISPTRIYDKEAGRYLSRDPVASAAAVNASTPGNALGKWKNTAFGQVVAAEPVPGQGPPNPYLYLQSNPLGQSDPTGLQGATVKGKARKLLIKYLREEIAKLRGTAWGKNPKRGKPILDAAERYIQGNDITFIAEGKDPLPGNAKWRKTESLFLPFEGQTYTYEIFIGVSGRPPRKEKRKEYLKCGAYFIEKEVIHDYIHESFHAVRGGRHNVKNKEGKMTASRQEELDAWSAEYEAWEALGHSTAGKGSERPNYGGELRSYQPLGKPKFPPDDPAEW